MALSPSNAVAVKLQQQLIARGRELNSKEGDIAVWEDGLAAFKRALGKVCMKHYSSHV
jgi:hypothetical protein